MRPITFATNTGANTLEYTKLLLKSLKENLDSQDHEILVFVDSDNDGTVDYLKSVKHEFKDLKIVTHKVKPIVGYQRNSNLIAELAKYDIISYLQSDMVVSKHYDTAVLQALEENTILSSTRIEPPLHGMSDKTITYDFGLHPEEFKFEQFVKFAETVKSSRTLDYFFAPYTFHRDTWLKIGGYDTLFRRAREDSDFVQRCLQAGISLKQTFSAVVYHFTCVSSRGKNWYDQDNTEAQARVQLQRFADQIELKKFIRKWGNFNHGETKLKKFDADLVPVGSMSERYALIAQLEPYFSRVWVKDEHEHNIALSFYKKDHGPANQLLNYTDEDWETFKKFFNTINYQEVYQTGEPVDFNVKVTVDLTKVGSEDEFTTNLHQLANILESAEPGTYELGSATIEVRNLVNLVESYIKVENPLFDYSLLTIE